MREIVLDGYCFAEELKKKGKLVVRGHSGMSIGFMEFRERINCSLFFSLGLHWII